VSCDVIAAGGILSPVLAVLTVCVINSLLEKYEYVRVRVSGKTVDVTTCGSSDPVTAMVVVADELPTSFLTVQVTVMFSLTDTTRVLMFSPDNSSLLVDQV
jgi:S-adenosylmethionine/arginine decarboxylase-like enzyme